MTRSPVPMFLAAAWCATASAQTQPPIHVFSGAPGEAFGQSLATGQIDGDGLPDLVVGLPYASPGGVAFAGSVEVYLTSTQTFHWSMDGSVAGGVLGLGVAVAPDVNGDGWGEILVGSPYETHAGGTEAGRARLLSGANGAVLRNVQGSGNYDWFGSALVGLEDFNGDGTPDFAVGAPTAGNGSGNVSRVVVYSGASGAVLTTLLGAQSNAFFGGALATCGDTNGDGVDDWLVGELGYSGSFSNSGRVQIRSGAGGGALRTIVGTSSFELFGSSVGGTGDIDGDGRGDVIVGAFRPPFAGPGLARVYSGASGALLRELQGETVGFGISVAGAGDYDGDGVRDVVVGAVDPYVSQDPGYARVYSGACGRVLGEYRGSGPASRLGLSVAGMEDANQDGLGDVVIGIPNESQAVLYRGEQIPQVVPYCTAGTSASGCAAALFASGTPSTSAASGFQLMATSVEGGADGIFFYGNNGRQAVSWGNGTSYQCVVPPVKRTVIVPGNGTPGACNGTKQLDLNAYWQAHPHKNPGAGSYVQVQLWYRDPASTSNQTTSLSNGIEVSPCP